MSDIDDVLLLPSSAEVRRLATDILVVRSLLPEWRNELIGISERINRWSRTDFARPLSGRGETRTGASFIVTANDGDYGPCLKRFELALMKAFHTGIQAYKKFNNFLNVAVDDGYEMVRYQEGEYFRIHTDTTIGAFISREVAAILYLNDSYDGGETYFPRQRLRFRAVAGDLLLFPANFCYPHESLPVSNGTKYVIVTWFGNTLPRAG